MPEMKCDKNMPLPPMVGCDGKPLEIGKLFKEGDASYRIVNGKKIRQIDEKTQADIDLNNRINFWRASKMFK